MDLTSVRKIEDLRGVVLHSSSGETGTSSLGDLIEAFLDIYKAMTGWDPQVKANDALIENSYRPSVIFDGLNSGGRIRFVDPMSPDLGASVLITHIKGEALILSIQKTYPTEVTFVTALIGSSAIKICGRESTAMEIIEKTPWKKVKDHGTTWGNGVPVEYWLTEKGLPITLASVKTNSYAEIIGKSDPRAFLPWDRD